MKKTRKVQIKLVTLDEILATSTTACNWRATACVVGICSVAYRLRRNTIDSEYVSDPFVLGLEVWMPGV
jgi:hypothetical protein